MLELRHGFKTYRSGTITTTALDNVSLRIDSGEMIAITGPSGSGKSTLLNILGCIDDLTSGQYLIDGVPVPIKARPLARLRNEVFGFVFQFFGLIPEYTALENAMLPLLYRNVRHGQAKLRAAEMLERLGMAAEIHKYPHHLSGGQQQRVAVARALVGEPRVILADEPTGSLDTANGAEVMRLLTAQNRRGTTVVIVTHSPEVAAMCPRQIHVRDGKIAETTQADNAER